ncbi:Protein GDAP2 like, partial [Pseudolycoriella hygida]
DDESDENPHNDLDDGSDLDYKYSNGFSLSSHLNIGQHSFSQMQGDLDRQRLLGDRPRANLYENIIEEGIEGIEHQEHSPLLPENDNE